MKDEIKDKIFFSTKDITFYGDTEEEKKANEELFNESLLKAQKDDEIKEILNYIKEHSNDEYKNRLELIDYECKILYDYITNLQQEVLKKEAMYDSLAVDYRLSQEENERLKMNKINDYMSKDNTYYKSFLIYKSRCEKALQIIKECKMLMPHEFDWEEQINNIENILQGSDEDE